MKTTSGNECWNHRNRRPSGSVLWQLRPGQGKAQFHGVKGKTEGMIQKAVQGEKQCERTADKTGASDRKGR